MDRKMLKRQNHKNRWITTDVVEQVMRDHGLPLKVHNIKIYQQAFIHKSYLKNVYHEEPLIECIPLQETCNETLEFLGDAILSSSVGTLVYKMYPNQDEGFLTKTRTKMVRGSTLGELARRIGFGEWVIISQHVELEDGRANPRILEDLFEAFIAAIYLDNGGDVIPTESLLLEEEIRNIRKKPPLDSSQVSLLLSKLDQLDKLREQSSGYLYAQRFIHSAFYKHVDIPKLAAFNDNYKEHLQTIYQQRYNDFPKWEVLRETGRANQKIHIIGIRDPQGFLLGSGQDRKKVDAEQLASKNVLIYLGIIPADHGEDFFHII
jgi:ribonuclease-3